MAAVTVSTNKNPITKRTNGNSITPPPGSRILEKKDEEDAMMSGDRRRSQWERGRVRQEATGTSQFLERACNNGGVQSTALPPSIQQRHG